MEIVRGDQNCTQTHTRRPILCLVFLRKCRNKTKNQFNRKIYWNRYSKCYFSTYSPLDLQHLSYRETNVCILCRRSLPPGIGTTVTFISAPLSLWKRWRWPDRNFLRCKKRWKSLGAWSGLQGGWWLNTSQPNSCRRFVDRRAVCSHRPGTPDDEFQSALSSVHSKTLSQIALHSRWDWNKSFHLQPLQLCYCEYSGSPASACVMRRHYWVMYTESLNAVNGLIAVGRVGNLIK